MKNSQFQTLLANHHETCYLALPATLSPNAALHFGAKRGSASKIVRCAAGAVGTRSELVAISEGTPIPALIRGAVRQKVAQSVKYFGALAEPHHCDRLHHPVFTCRT